jgi:hypothetical protein
MKSLPSLSLIDGGLAFNYPMASLLHPNRAMNPDIIILMDASGDILSPQACNNKNYNQFLETWKIRFPEIQLEDIVSISDSSEFPGLDQPTYILRTQKETQAGPLLIYIPLLPEKSPTGVAKSRYVDPLTSLTQEYAGENIRTFDPSKADWCTTGNFQLTGEQTRLLARYMQDKVSRSKSLMVDAINEIIAQKLHQRDMVKLVDAMLHTE